MMISPLKTAIFKCLYEYPRLAYPHGDFTFKVAFFHAKFADLSLTFPNLRSKYNNGAFVESKKKKLKKKIEKKNWKKLKKIHQKRVAGCHWHGLNMPRTYPGLVQDMPRTWQDTWGLIWVFKKSKSDQNPPRYRHFCNANRRTNVSNMQSFCY